MNAPLVELLVRSANAVMATVAFVVLFSGWRLPRRPAVSLMRFLMFVVGNADEYGVQLVA